MNLCGPRVERAWHLRGCGVQGFQARAQRGSLAQGRAAGQLGRRARGQLPQALDGALRIAGSSKCCTPLGAQGSGKLIHAAMLPINTSSNGYAHKQLCGVHVMSRAPHKLGRMACGLVQS